jgi:hypothetical protein
MSMFKRVAGKARKVELDEAKLLIEEEEQEEMRKKAHAATEAERPRADSGAAKRKP